MSRELTKGEIRLDFKFEDENTFNPVVFELKFRTSELVNILETIKEEKKDNPEALRAISVAQTEYETACMWAVKSIFKNKE